MTRKTRNQLEQELANANEALEYALSLSPERDNNFFTGGLSPLYESRSSWDRKKVFAESMRAWRVNPIARRIVKLITSFVIGKGITIKCEHEATQKFLADWWAHPLNRIDRNAKRWKDEDTRTGNLFILCTIDATGMLFARAVPAEQIEDIETRDNDIEQELGYYKDATLTDQWPAYNPQAEQDSFMLHFASNKPVGSAWGEADLSPLLVWIGRYSSWLEDRVRLNRFRTAFMYVIRGAYASETERKRRETELKANPPQPGSLLVLNSNNGEEWGILSASLDSFDASVDGLTIKKMISAGVGFPMHYLAEPEGSTRTTAEAAGTPTFRTLEETQDDFFTALTELARVAVQVRSRTDKSVDPEAKITIEGPDITERDNATLALALGRAYPNLSDMLDREAIDDKEFMRLTYKMFAEVWDGKKVPTIKRKPLEKPGTTQPASNPGTDETDPKDDSEEQSNSAVDWNRQLQEIIAHIPEPKTPEIHITNQMPDQPAPSVQIDVQPPAVTVTNQIPDQPAPVVNVTNQVETPAVSIENTIPAGEPPQVQVINQVETPSVNIENQIQEPTVKIMPQNVETEIVMPRRKRKK